MQMHKGQIVNFKFLNSKREEQEIQFQVLKDFLCFIITEDGLQIYESEDIESFDNLEELGYIKRSNVSVQKT